MEIAVDFDGTITTHAWPLIGTPLKGCIETLKELQSNGHRLILFTMRSGKELQESVDYLNENGVTLYGVNTNPTQKNWTQSPKAYAQVFIDDAALGCPLLFDREISTRPFVNWSQVRVLLKEKGLL